MTTPTPITIQTAAPTRALPTGAVASAFFIVENNRVVLTDHNGHALHDPEGRDYTRELGGTDTPREIAGQLFRRFRTKVRGDGVSGFDRPLVYGKAQRVPW
jgi:hypothetical protein